MFLILSGTNRPGANTHKVARYVKGEFDKLRDDVELLDLAALKPDIFSPTAYAEKPGWFESEFQKPILEAKGMVVVTPEYNGSFPGVMKYFIDMLKFPESLVGLPVAFVGVAAGYFGALRSVEQLELLFHYRSSHIFGERIFVPKIHEYVKEDSFTPGDMRERFESLCINFNTFCKQLQNESLHSE